MRQQSYINTIIGTPALGLSSPASSSNTSCYSVLYDGLESAFGSEPALLVSSTLQFRLQPLLSRALGPESPCWMTYCYGFTFCFGPKLKVRSRSYFHASTARKLNLARQIEMFAEVAASSMPTVFQFFHRQYLSLVSRRSILEIIFSRPLRVSARIELPELDPSFPNWDSDRKIHSSSHRELIKMKELKLDRGDRHGANPDQVPNLLRRGYSQTHLIHGIIVMANWLENTLPRSIAADLL